MFLGRNLKNAGLAELFPPRIKRINKLQLNVEIDSFLILSREAERWPSCYFQNVGSDLLHVEGLCISCDWKRYVQAVTESELDNWSFVEAWDWPDVWLRKYHRP